MSLSQNWQNLVQSMKSTNSSSAAAAATIRRSKIKLRKPEEGKVSVAKRGSAMSRKSLRSGDVIKMKVDTCQAQLNSKRTEDTDNKLTTNTQNTNIQNRKGKGNSEIGRYVAIDCEFVGVGPEGKEHALARISMVNYYGNVVLDEYVRPKERVVDWRTKVSGIKPSDMVNAIPFELAQEKCAAIIKDRILVGHDLQHDLEALLLSHPKSMIRDTALHVPYRRTYSKGRKPSLKKLAREILKMDIQGGQHSSVEDARATMLLYKHQKKVFERLNHHYTRKLNYKKE